MFRNKSASTHNFAMIPRADIPRSSFPMRQRRLMTFDAGYLIPMYCEEVLPGDTFNTRLTAFCRMATPVFPIMDNLYMETFYFFVPMRLVWQNFQRFMGEQPNPGDSTDFVIPTLTRNSLYDVGTIFDYFGLPVTGQGSSGYTHSALPFRAYNLIFNEWFRDQNLQNSLVVETNDSGDAPSDYALVRRGKRHDYFTACLPFAQKGDPVELSLGALAPVIANEFSSTSAIPAFRANPTDTAFRNLSMVASQAGAEWDAAPTNSGLAQWQPGYHVAGPDTGQPFTGLVADLSDVAAFTVNALRMGFQVQKLLERDARGGTRYTEIIRAHFGVISPDARLQRPEYLGGGSTMINITPVAQTSETVETPQGNLAAFGTAVVHNHGFTQSFTEHGYVIGLVSVRADITYQQGLRRMWSRSTRYDFYWPVFSHLGEQAVLSKEIFCNGDAEDEDVFGYQERWAEYRYTPSQICGLFRSGAPQPLDAWHLAQNFGSRPVLNAAFIEENPPMERILAVGEAAGGQQFLFDGLFETRAARPLPMYSVPGLIDHF